MTASNFYFIAIKPTLFQELETRALQGKLLSTKNSEAVVKPVYLPLSFQFNTDEDGIFKLGNLLQQELNEVKSFELEFNLFSCTALFKQISMLMEPNTSFEVLQSKIVSALLQWNRFDHSPVALELPKAEVALARTNWSLPEFKQAEKDVFSSSPKQKWSVETVSMMEWTDYGWAEKFFFPLNEQRLLRKQSQTILRDK